MTDQTTTETATRSPQRQVMELVRTDDFKLQVADALPENVTPERFVRAAATAVLANPDIAKADRDSIFAALLKSAQDGLLPDGREAALVTYKTKVKVNGQDTWVEKAQYLPMIGGFRKIAGEHGWTLMTRAVYANDEFEHVLGLNENIRHIPVRPGADRGPLIAAYAIARHRDGRVEIDVMYAEDIAKVRASSRASERGPWVDWPDRMWEKTVGRRLFKKLTLGEKDSDRVRRLLAADELESGDAARQLYGPTDMDTPRGLAADVTDGALSLGATDQESRVSGGTGGGDDEQTGGEATSPAPAAGSSPDTIDGEATDVTDEPEPTLFAIPDAVVQKAGQTTIPKGDRHGLTLAQVLAQDEQGADYLLWSLKRPAAYWTKAFRDQLELFVRGAAPDTWAGYQQWLDDERQVA